MTTTDEAFAAVGMLVAAIPGFREDEILGLSRLLAKDTDDGAALIEACEQLARTWEGRMRPSEKEILDAYYAHPTVKRAREDRVAYALAHSSDSTFCGGSGWVVEDNAARTRRPCARCNPYLHDVWQDQTKWEQYRSGTALHVLHPDVDAKGKTTTPMPAPCKLETRYDPERVPTTTEGMQIAADEFRALYGRAIGEMPVVSPDFVVSVVEMAGHHDSNGEWLSNFDVVLDAFAGDQKRARASLRALGKRVVWAHNGYHFTLKRATDPPVEPPEPRTTPSGTLTPRDPSEPNQDAAEMMREALSTVGRRMDEV